MGSFRSAFQEVTQELRNSKMGKHFGNLGVKVSGVITYSLSPFEQKAFAGVISHGVPNLFRRFRGQVLRVAPPFVLGYLVYDWGEKENKRAARKDPAQFAEESS